MKSIRTLFLTLLSLMILGSSSAFAQSLVKVSGVVTSAEDDLPMIGVGVLAGPGVGVTTSLDGDYVIEVAAGTQLTFTSIGYQDVVVVVPAGNEFVHNVVMQPESMQLDDVVVIAYGVRKKET